MSSQSSAYSEKKIAAYESLFKESNFAKPQEVYLTITVAHVFGQAYILEQEGTKEGDPVYSRFLCPLEEITKVYVNDKIKKPWPLFIQCDTNVKGVIHRKRIVVPCLTDPNSIAEQINEVRAIHMQKYEAALERENKRKRAELENARMKEQLKSESKSILPPLAPVAELPDELVMESPVISEPAPKAPKAKSEKTPTKSKGAEPKSIKALSSELADSFKALESIDSSKPEIKPLPKKPVFDFDDFDASFPSKSANAPKEEAVKPAPEAPEPVSEEPKREPVPEEPKKTDIVDLADIDDAIVAMPKPEEIAEKVGKPVETNIPEPVIEAVPEPDPEPVPEPVAETMPELEPVPEPQPEPVPAPAPVIAPKPVMVNPTGKAAELSEFESAVIQLKARLDSGEISSEEYAAEKKKLISTLY